MIPSQTCLHRARVTIELTSPMMIPTGRSNHANDNNFIRDENGLPVIPATSITGVMRHLLVKANHPLASEFGYAGEEDNLISSIHISNAIAHDGGNTVQEAVKSSGEDDSVLHLLKQDAPVQRNGVAITIRGVAKNGAKHDRTLVPTGTRFSFELSWWSESLNQQQWQEMLAVLAHPLCSFGGGTRNGQGNFRIVDIRTKLFSLTEEADAKAFRALPRRLSQSVSDVMQPLSIEELTTLAATLIPVKTVQLRLKPENGWRIGGGTESFSGAKKPPDMLQFSEARIEWADERGEVNEHVMVIPGTSIKGAFSHRLEFHFRRLRALWAVDDTHAYRDTDVRQLFGFVDDESAQAGYIWFADSYVTDSPKVYARTRNKIDRFTGGTIDKALFSEERVYSEAMTVSITMDQNAMANLEPSLKADFEKAFDLTLRDLRTGRLAIGAGQNNGNGFFYEVNEDGTHASAV